MKILKSIGLFCIYPLCMFLIGMYIQQSSNNINHAEQEQKEISMDNQLDIMSVSEKKLEQEEVLEVQSSQIPEQKNHFYLKVENNYIAVYENDNTTLYVSTDILLEQLPFALQQEIIDTKYIEDVQSLYDFLEAYSS